VLHTQPNYFGEIVMWTGIAAAATGSLSSPVQFLLWLSPAFTVLLLTKVRPCCAIFGRANFGCCTREMLSWSLQSQGGSVVVYFERGASV
jgi:hypothetical protein